MRLTFDRLRAAERYPAPGPDCLDELGVAAAVDGTATPQAIAHLSNCSACRAQVAQLARLLGDGSVAREVDRLSGGRRFPRGAAPLAAAALLLLALIPFVARTDRGAGDFRDEPQAPAATAPVLRTPLTRANELASLHWSGVAGATQYRVTIFDEEGGLVWTAETGDTAVAFPGDSTLVAGTPYWWRVEARVDFDRWNASGLGTFTVGAEP
jgi:hypothetical protein